jgi:hypothetical protein
MAAGVRIHGGHNLVTKIGHLLPGRRSSGGANRRSGRRSHGMPWLIDLWGGTEEVKAEVAITLRLSSLYGSPLNRLLWLCSPSFLISATSPDLGGVVTGMPRRFFVRCF